MNDLIQIKETNGRETVDARQLHAALEVTTRFNDWIARRIENYGFIEGKDFYSKMSKTPEGGRPADRLYIIGHAVSVGPARTDTSGQDGPPSAGGYR